jgi:hypothetical protein
LSKQFPRAVRADANNMVSDFIGHHRGHELAVWATFIPTLPTSTSVTPRRVRRE